LAGKNIGFCGRNRKTALTSIPPFLIGDSDDIVHSSPPATSKRAIYAVNGSFVETKQS